MTCGIIHQGGDFRLTVYVCFSWEMALNFGLKISFDVGVERNTGENWDVSTKAYIRNETVEFSADVSPGINTQNLNFCLCILVS
jgi:hypothetical protein